MNQYIFLLSLDLGKTVTGFNGDIKSSSSDRNEVWIFSLNAGVCIIPRMPGFKGELNIGPGPCLRLPPNCISCWANGVISKPRALPPRITLHGNGEFLKTYHIQILLSKQFKHKNQRERERERERERYPWMSERNINLGWKEWKTPMLDMTEHMILEYVVCLIWASWAVILKNKRNSFKETKQNTFYKWF